MQRLRGTRSNGHALQQGRIIAAKAYAMGVYLFKSIPVSVYVLKCYGALLWTLCFGERQSAHSPEAAMAMVGKVDVEVETTILWRRLRLTKLARIIRPAWRP